MTNENEGEMSKAVNGVIEDERVILSDQQKSARRKRSIAIAIGLFSMVIIFYWATITKFGPRLMDRPIISIHTK